jgi:hypothetical protein
MIENEIHLYTFQELLVMKRRHGKSNLYHIFSSQSIDEEIQKRLKEKEEADNTN